MESLALAEEPGRKAALLDEPLSSSSRFASNTPESPVLLVALATDVKELALPSGRKPTGEGLAAAATASVDDTASVGCIEGHWWSVDVASSAVAAALSAQAELRDAVLPRSPPKSDGSSSPYRASPEGVAVSEVFSCVWSTMMVGCVV